MDIKEFDVKLRKQYCYDNNVNPRFMNDKLFCMWLIKRAYQKEVDSVYDISEGEIYDLLNDIVKWYHKFSSVANPDELLDYKDKIVTCNYWLSQQLSEAEKKHNLKEQLNKLEIERLIDESPKGTMVTQARAKAKNIKRPELLAEAGYKSKIAELENLLSSLDKMLNAMQQRIAWLRQEASKSQQV